MMNICVEILQFLLFFYLILKLLQDLNRKFENFFQVSKALQYTCIFEYTSNGRCVSMISLVSVKWLLTILSQGILM